MEEEKLTEGSDLDVLISKLGPCSKVYWEMDKCLDANNHQWSLCQTHVLQLKECHKIHNEPIQQQLQIKRQIQYLKNLKHSDHQDKK